jgi:uncharacterized protein YjaG (DUF416 family)
MDLNSLNHWQQLSFCAAICERSMPNFQLFCELEETPEQFKQSRKILNKVWEYLRGQLNSMKNIEKQLEVLNELVPDPTQHESFGAYPAMDCMVTLQSCIQGILDDSINDAQSMQTMTHERLLEVFELQELSKDESPLWSRQLAFEQAVLDLICAKDSHAHIIKELIPLSHDLGVSQLGISLDD